MIDYALKIDRFLAFQIIRSHETHNKIKNDKIKKHLNDQFSRQSFLGTFPTEQTSFLFKYSFLF
jgi:hypothetical protein